MKPINLLAWVLACLWLTTGVAHAQGVGSSGSINGTVTDPAGAVVPRASIVAVETARGGRFTAVTDNDGEYRLTGLPPATYDVTAQIAGFQTEVQKGVNLTVGAVVVVDFRLKISAAAEAIEVSAEPPMVETQRASQANTVTQQDIASLPIDRRDYLTITLLMPGVSNSTRVASDLDFRVKQTPQSGLSFYGSNGRGNSVTVDGGEANDDSGGVRLNLSQDAVQEFQINRSNYSAELGGASGASINIVSKSGSNQAHGSLYGFFRNDALDARDPFAASQALQAGQTFDPTAPDSQSTPVKNSLSRQQFGGTAGFPIKKDKTFLFVAFEGLRQDAQNAVPILTNTKIFRPTAAQQAIINSLGPAGLPLQRALTVAPNPLLSPAQNARSTFLINQFEANGGLFNYTTREYLASGRFDHRFSDKNLVFLRYNYAHDREESPDVQSLTGFSRGSSVHNYDSTIQGAWFHLFSPATSNEARSQWGYNSFNVIPNVPGQVGLDIPGFANFGTQIFLPNLTITRRYEFADNLTMTRGRHSLKFGGYGLIRGNHSESHTFFPGRFVFGSLPGDLVSPALATTTINSLQAAALGLPQFYQQGFDNPVYIANRPFAAFYGQDSWAIRPNLTFNFGLRYELDVQYGNLNTDKDNFAPRVSFAWDPFKDHKTVVRGGYGIFYAPVYAQIPNVVQTLGIVNGFRQIAQQFRSIRSVPVSSAAIFQTLFAKGRVECTTPAPGSAACITPADLTPFGITITHTGPIPPGSVIFSGQPDYQNPYSQQGEFGIEREIGAGFSVSASYIYVHTLKLPVALDINLLPAPFLPAGPANIPIRQWGGTNCPGGNHGTGVTCFVDPLILQSDQYSSAGAALYQGGILEVRKRFRNHFTLLGNYTFSKAIDQVTDFNSDYGPNDQTNLAAERGLSTFDQRNKVVIAAVLESPWKGGEGSSLQERIFSGFRLSPIVRYNGPHPFNVLAGTSVNNDNHSTTKRPPGAGRNTGIGPNYADFDLRLSRQFKLTEKSSLQFMAEGFNVFNRTNFGSVNNVVGVIAPPFNLRGNRALSPSQPLGFTSAFPRRQLQFGLRLSF